jgi:hypothetical protein
LVGPVIRVERSAFGADGAGATSELGGNFALDYERSFPAVAASGDRHAKRVGRFPGAHKGGGKLPGVTLLRAGYALGFLGFVFLRGGDGVGVLAVNYLSYLAGTFFRSRGANGQSGGRLRDARGSGFVLGRIEKIGYAVNHEADHEAEKQNQRRA